MDAPNYVQGLYTVAQRDAIFAKADKYPDASNGLQNQVPTIFPDGSIGWRQIPEGGDGTANANIAVVEQTQYASYNYTYGDWLIYNDQLYRVIAPILAGEELNQSNLKSITVGGFVLTPMGKGENLLRNWYFKGGGSQQGGGQLPINQLGSLTYTAPGQTVDGWIQTGGTTTVGENYLQHASPAGEYSDFYQVIELPLGIATYSDMSISFSAIAGSRFRSGAAVISDLTAETVVAFYNTYQLILQIVSGNRIKATIRVFAGETVSISMAKVEFGSQSTLTGISDGSVWDPPPDYGEELAKCQRHQVVFVTGSGNDALIGYGYCYNATTYIFSLPTPVTMARRPANPIQCGGAYCTAHGADLPITALNAYWSANVNSINLVATVASGGIAGESAILKLSSGWMILDADAEDSRSLSMSVEGGEQR